uniref:Uncharacterized protein n=1 Tax=Arundo donax TaxID=35708 RepID=A0A0A9F1M2_ARUDO
MQKYGNHPVIFKEPVNNLPHSQTSVQKVMRIKQQHIQVSTLQGQSCSPVLQIRIEADAIVNVAISQEGYDSIHNRFRKRKPPKQVFRLLYRNNIRTKR